MDYERPRNVHAERRKSIFSLNLSQDQIDLMSLPDFPWMEIKKGVCRWCGGPAKTPRSTWCGTRNEHYRDGWMMPCNSAIYQWWWQASALRRAIFHRDNFMCQLCGASPTRELRGRAVPDLSGLHMDHIIPIVGGGKTEWVNLQTLCAKCNLRKGGRVSEVFEARERNLLLEG